MENILIADIDNDIKVPVDPRKGEYRKLAEKMKLGDSVFFESISKAQCLLKALNDVWPQRKNITRTTESNGAIGRRVWSLPGRIHKQRQKEAFLRKARKANVIISRN